MAGYDLQRAVYDRLRGCEGVAAVHAETDHLAELSAPERAALRIADLRALAEFGVHPVLIHALARATERNRDQYRVLLLGTGPVREGRPRWRES
jgi:hypothetical protein